VGPNEITTPLPKAQKPGAARNDVHGLGCVQRFRRLPRRRASSHSKSGKPAMTWVGGGVVD